MRYHPLTEADRRVMLSSIGVKSTAELYRRVPDGKLLKGHIDKDFPGLSPSKGELEVERIMSGYASRSTPAGSVPFFVGCGAYRHHVPASVDHLIQRSEFLTAYTPYQPEVSQGTLQVLFEFQTQVARLVGMEVANASMYDGSTAAAEAVLMAHRVTRRRKAVVSGGLHPQYRAVIETLSHHGGAKVDALALHPQGEEDLAARIDADTSAVVVQYPDVLGEIRDYSKLAEAAHAKGALLIVVVTEVMALGLVKSPGEMGADIVAAEGQSIGNGLNFGGPYVGLFATREKFVRQMPGRLCGETVDAEGRRGFVLTLSTREQHIRREKATSNICTNSGLCALAFSIHMTLLGEKGLRGIAALNHEAAVDLADRLARVPGVKVLNKAFFNEIAVTLPGDAEGIVEKLAQKGVLAGVPLKRLLPERDDLKGVLIAAATETTTQDDRAAFAGALKEVL